MVPFVRDSHRAAADRTNSDIGLTKYLPGRRPKRIHFDEAGLSRLARIPWAETQLAFRFPSRGRLSFEQLAR